MAGPNDLCWRLEIANGPNEGAVVALPDGRYRLGLDRGNDIVLADQEVAAEQASLEIGPGGARLTSLAANTTLRHRTLATGQSRAVRAGSDIRVGNTVLRVEGPRRRRAAISRFAPLAAGLLIACSTVAGYVFATPSHGRDVAAAAGAPPPRAGTALAGAADTLRRHLRAAGLAGGIAVGERDGALLASGAIAPDRREDWNRTEQWFDMQFARVTLVDRVGTTGRGRGPDLALAAVSTYPLAVAIARDGARYTEGAVLDDGWTIERITTRAVTLTRDGQTVTLVL